MGPIDVIILGFPGNKFSGQIVPAVKELVASRTITIIDLLFITKDGDGNVAVIELKDLDPELGPAYMEIDLAHVGALDHEDADEIADDIPANSSALVIAYENTWASRFVAAVVEAEGVMIDQFRIPVEVVAQALVKN